VQGTTGPPGVIVPCRFHSALRPMHDQVGMPRLDGHHTHPPLPFACMATHAERSGPPHRNDQRTNTAGGVWKEW